MRRFVRIGFACAALAAGALFAASAQAGSVRGTVRDQATLAPLSGAWVTVQVLHPDSLALSAPTDADGHYEILGIPPGNATYVVTAAAALHAISWASFQDLGSTDLTYDIVLPVTTPPPPPGTPDSTHVSGTVRVASGQNGTLVPVSGAAVSLASGAGSFLLHTDATGRYDGFVPTTTYAFTVSASGCQTLASPAVQIAGTNFVLDAALRSTVSVSPPGPAIGFALRGAVPHPLKTGGAVWFELPVASRVSLRMFDAAGRWRATLLEGVAPQGLQSAHIETSGLASGVYLVRMEATPLAGGRTFAAARRVVVLR